MKQILKCVSSPSFSTENLLQWYYLCPPRPLYFLLVWHRAVPPKTRALMLSQAYANVFTWQWIIFNLFLTSVPQVNTV